MGIFVTLITLHCFPNKFGYPGNIGDLSVELRRAVSGVNTLNHLTSLRMFCFVKSIEILRKSCDMLEIDTRKAVGPN